jgi:hypothetical protein
MTRTYRFFFPTIVLALMPALASPQVQTGTPSFGSFSPGGPEVINLANLNAHWTIPVLHKPGRGMNFNYDLTYDSSVWYPVGSSGSQVWQPVFNWGWASNGNVGYITNSQSGNLCYSNGYPIGHTQTISNWAYYDPWGINHVFNGQIVSSTCPGVTNILSFTSVAADGSGLSMNIGVNGVAPIVTKEGLGLYPPSNPTSGSPPANNED